MNNKRLILSLLVFILTLSFFTTSCGSPESSSDEQPTAVDEQPTVILDYFTVAIHSPVNPRELVLDEDNHRFNLTLSEFAVITPHFASVSPNYSIGWYYTTIYISEGPIAKFYEDEQNSKLVLPRREGEEVVMVKTWHDKEKTNLAGRFDIIITVTK